MNRSNDHTVLLNEIRQELGDEPDFTLWLNSKVTMRQGKPIAKPGLVKGSSDLLGILEPQGRIVALEAKTGNAKPSADQQMFLNLVRKRGGFAAVVRSVDDARSALARARLGLKD
jgi:hypothetical protein